MKIMVLGLRGFPGVQGGIETHAEHLYPILRDLGCELEVVTRTPYCSKNQEVNELTKGIRFHPMWCPLVRGAEAFVHSFLGVLYAGLKRPDVLHIHAIGPALFTPLAKLFGLRVVVTHHGSDYAREKWNGLAKTVLRLGERWGMGYADARIVISNVIAKDVYRMYGRDSVFIPNGVDIPGRLSDNTVVKRLELTPQRYLVNVSRMVPEKHHLDLISAFAASDLKGWKLVLVGNLDDNDSYCRKVIEAAQEVPGVVLAGFRTGEELKSLYANAGIFVLPSTHEGLPIALLEALSYGLPAIASDIPANKEVGLPRDHYFRVGDVSDLTVCLNRIATQYRPSDYRSRLQAWVRSKYDWRQIARETLRVYSDVVSRGFSTKASSR
ncbi:MAG: glycosyltransferase family 4 protein [Chromatiales bacterium]|nr:glycosyltransferase family 4 protein [Chromatiales bacterium]